MRPVPGRAARWFTVPAGTPAGVCRGLALGGCCNARVYWVRSALGIVAVDTEIAGGRRPTEARSTAQLDLFLSRTPVADGLGVLHNDTCPDAALFLVGASMRRVS